MAFDYVPGCVEAKIDKVWVWAEWDYADYPRQPPTRTDLGSCARHGMRFTCSYGHDAMPSGTTVTGLSMYVSPRDRRYGGIDYAGGNKFSDVLDAPFVLE